MIKLPERLVSEAFDGQIRQGAVLYYIQIALKTGIRNKFLVLLNRGCSCSKIYYFLTTSQTKFYISNRKLRKYFVFVPENTISFFPLPTLIDCRSAECISRDKLREKYGERELEFRGMLPEPFITKITDIVKTSRLIPERTKKLILGIE